MKISLFSVLIFLCVSLAGQENPPYWFTDMETAQTYTTEHKVPLLLVFAGSDWCRPCIQFKQDILQSDTFSVYATDHLAVLYLDFPARRKNKLPEAQTLHNEQLAEQYNRQGAFPKLVVLDTNGEILVEPEFKGQQAAEFIRELSLKEDTE
jgi:thioredoxin-related protein